MSAERWAAALAQLDRAIALVYAADTDQQDDAALVAINAAIWDMHQARHEVRGADLEAAWAGAWHRAAGAQFEWRRRSRQRRVMQSIESVRCGAADLLARVPELVR